MRASSHNLPTRTYRQDLDLRRGVLVRRIRFEDVRKHLTTVKERRIVSMSDMHLDALELTLMAENWSDSVKVRSAIDGRIVNAGAKLYRKFNNQHLEPIKSEALGEDAARLLVRTCQSDLRVSLVARTDGEPQDGQRRVIIKQSRNDWTSLPVPLAEAIGSGAAVLQRKRRQEENVWQIDCQKGRFSCHTMAGPP